MMRILHVLVASLNIAIGATASAGLENGLEVGRPRALPTLRSIGLRSLCDIRGGALSDSDSEDAEVASDSESDDEDEAKEQMAKKAKRRDVKPLALDEGPLDRALRVAQMAGGVVGGLHDTLRAMNPILNLVLSNALYTQLGASLLLMRYTKKIDYDNRSTLFKIRVFYSCSMAAIQLIYLLVRHAVCKANDESEVVITNSLVDGLLTASKGLNGDSGEESNGPAGLAALAAGAARKITTAREYDLGLAKRNAAQHFPSMAMMYFFHFRKDWHRAVLFAPVGPLVQALTDPLFQIHIMGREAEGALARPFKSAQQRMLEDMGAGKDDASEEATAEGDDAEGGAVGDDETEGIRVLDDDSDDEGPLDE
mmetsp:Transcript_41606/g.93884  ORF Transcript_41606/g.93884 Transcript_41606/m.93884 type:complete len:367 (+) Transcript_41606:50-1150(+)